MFQKFVIIAGFVLVFAGFTARADCITECLADYSSCDAASYAGEQLCEISADFALNWAIAECGLNPGLDYQLCVQYAYNQYDQDIYNCNAFLSGALQGCQYSLDACLVHCG